MCGPAGTDGAAVGRLHYDLLRAHGAISADLVERSALSFAGDVASVAMAKLADMADAAAGGMLLITDAGALADDASAARALGASLRSLPAGSAAALLGGADEVTDTPATLPLLPILPPAPMTTTPPPLP